MARPGLFPMRILANVAFKLDFYAQVQDLSYLLEHLNESPRTKRYRALNEAICELIEDFGLVSFETLAVEAWTLLSYSNHRIKDRWQSYWRPLIVRRAICLAALRRQQIISGHQPHAQDGHPISMSWTSRNVGSIIKKN